MLVSIMVYDYDYDYEYDYEYDYDWNYDWNYDWMGWDGMGLDLIGLDLIGSDRIGFMIVKIDFWYSSSSTAIGIGASAVTTETRIVPTVGRINDFE